MWNLHTYLINVQLQVENRICHDFISLFYFFDFIWLGILEETLLSNLQMSQVISQKKEGYLNNIIF